MSDDPVLLPPPTPDDAPLRRALDCLLEGFQIIGFDWKYVYLNPAAARHGRRPAHELVGMSIIDEYPGIDQTPLWQVLRRCMEDRTSHVVENQFTFPDGTTRWFELRVQPVPEGICVYSSDIEPRKTEEFARMLTRRGWRADARGGLLGWFARLFARPDRPAAPHGS